MSILLLPVEVLRQVIQDLLADPTSPNRFRKSELLPLASTCHVLRAASIEFLYWSVDLFEASFGLRHRVLKSNIALQLFNDTIDSPSSYMRTGIRKFLVRDRDETASGDLWTVLGKLQNLRSLHLDGVFNRTKDPFPPAPEDLMEPKEELRLYWTLVNLTFRCCSYQSPLFPFFFRKNTFHNLTRIEFIDKFSDPSDLFRQLNAAQQSPFATVSSSEEPIFPYLNTFALTHYCQTPGHFSHFLRFMEIHKDTLKRVSVLTRTSEGRSLPHANRDAHSYAHELQQECIKNLWSTIRKLHNMQLLELDACVTSFEYRPTAIISPPRLKGVRIQTNNQWHPLAHSYGLDEHPVTEFFGKIRAPHVAYGPSSISFHTIYSAGGSSRRTTLTEEWFMSAKLAHVRSFTNLETDDESTTMVLLEGSREVSDASAAQKREIWGAVGGWSIQEDANLKTPFVSEKYN